MADLVILNDPTFAPMGADQPNLLGGRWRPRRGRIPQGEAAHGEVVDARLFGVKDRLADVDLHQLLFGGEPVAVDEVAVGVELPKETVGKGCLPSVELDPFPARDNLRSLDGHLLTFGGLVHNALLIGLAPPRRVDALAIDASVHSDYIARLRPKRSSRNSLEHPAPGTLDP